MSLESRQMLCVSPEARLLGLLMSSTTLEALVTARPLSVAVPILAEESIVTTRYSF